MGFMVTRRTSICPLANTPFLPQSYDAMLQGWLIRIIVGVDPFQFIPVLVPVPAFLLSQVPIA